MHTSGKVAAGLIIVLAGLAIYFSARGFAIRDAWMKLAQDNEATIKKNETEIAELTRKLDEKRKDLARTMLGWDRYWPEVPGQLNANGTITLKIGAAQHVTPEQVLYAFAVNQDGSSTYVGDFKTLSVKDNTVDARPNSRRRPNDVKIPAQFVVRVRSMLPSQFTARLGTLDQQLLAVELAIANDNEELARQAQLMQQSEKAIANRMAELNGNPELAQKTIPGVHVAGLLTSIVEEEEARNAALIEADRLMRELRNTRLEFEQIRKENQKLVESLPQPATAEPTVGSAGR